MECSRVGKGGSARAMAPGPDTHRPGPRARPGSPRPGPTPALSPLDCLPPANDPIFSDQHRQSRWQEFPTHRSPGQPDALVRPNSAYFPLTCILGSSLRPPMPTSTLHPCPAGDRVHIRPQNIVASNLLAHNRLACYTFPFLKQILIELSKFDSLLRINRTGKKNMEAR